MDISGFSTERIVRVANNIFNGGNHANFQIRGNMFHAMMAAHYFQRKGHAVEWRYKDFINLFISRFPLEIVLTVATVEDVTRLKQAIVSHGLLCCRLKASGSEAINLLWSVIMWCSQRGFRLEHRTSFSMNVFCAEAILRKPFETIDSMDIE